MCDLHCTGFEPDRTGLQPIKLSTAPQLTSKSLLGNKIVFLFLSTF